MFIRPLIIVVYLLVVSPLSAADAPDIDEQTRAIAQELRCVVCQNLSVADSPSEMAQQMRAIVREQLQAGKSPEQIKDFFVSKYGEWVLLTPKTTGFSALLWILPYVVLCSASSPRFWFIRRWVNKKKPAEDASGRAPIPQPVQSELSRAEALEHARSEDASASAQLLRERARLRTELTDLDFDFQSGKLCRVGLFRSQTGNRDEAAGVIQQLNTFPPEPHGQAAARR